MDLIAAWFSHLNDTTGINFTVFYDPFDRARFAHGFLVTLQLCGVTIIGSVLVGIFGAWGQGARSIWRRRFVQAYIQMFRNTPPLVQVYFFYFGLSALLPTVKDAIGNAHPLIGGFIWASISLICFAGAFNVEIFRSGIEAIPHSTIEAAEALGYTRLQTYRHIVLPLGLRICMPALTNNLVNLIKTTPLAYAIAVPELLYVSNQIWSDNENVPEMMILLFFIYIALVGLLVFAMHAWEKSLRVPGLGK
ncbi:MAG: polar amino acid ABC transporter permease [Acidocella sp. 20-57-95]|nr:MAG: polar amino acid ABC transporter permease [Acidocella sp. 20-57-95]OYV60222.1 MAG: polar amino acid ABC transporter permease [Acidocella sp. 21-58-7]HQT63173.1 amino acid ABC transporter permease [Acidocella sp.]HQU04782.1 amino acid ABC transporter permease [Acidocella sp.]